MCVRLRHHVQALYRARRRPQHRHGAEALKDEQQGVGAPQRLLIQEVELPGLGGGREPPPRVAARDADGVDGRVGLGGEVGGGGGERGEDGRRGAEEVGVELGAEGEAVKRNQREADERVLVGLALAMTRGGGDDLDENGERHFLASHRQKGGGEELAGTIQIDGGAEIRELLGE